MRDKVRESLPMERRVNAAKWPASHTVLPICLSLALRRTCGHPEAGGRGGLSPLSSAGASRDFKLFLGEADFPRWPFCFERKRVINFQAKSDLSSPLSETPFLDIAGSTWTVCLLSCFAPPLEKSEPSHRVQLQEA